MKAPIVSSKSRLTLTVLPVSGGLRIVGSLTMSSFEHADQLAVILIEQIEGRCYSGEPKSELMHLTERIKPAHPQQNGRHAASRRLDYGNNLALWSRRSENECRKCDGTNQTNGPQTKSSVAIPLSFSRNEWRVFPARFRPRLQIVREGLRTNSRPAA